MELESVWSGSLERQGACPSLSGYMGRSTLFICETRAPKETRPIWLHKAERQQAAMRKYRQTAKAKAADRERQRARVKAAREQKRLCSAKHNALRRAAQQASLFQ